jgi:hypothetical protein
MTRCLILHRAVISLVTNRWAAEASVLDIHHILFSSGGKETRNQRLTPPANVGFTFVVTSVISSYEVLLESSAVMQLLVGTSSYVVTRQLSSGTEQVAAWMTCCPLVQEVICTFVETDISVLWLNCAGDIISVLKMKAAAEFYRTVSYVMNIFNIIKFPYKINFKTKNLVHQIHPAQCGSD